MSGHLFFRSFGRLPNRPLLNALTLLLLSVLPEDPLVTILIGKKSCPPMIPSSCLERRAAPLRRLAIIRISDFGFLSRPCPPRCSSKPPLAFPLRTGYLSLTLRHERALFQHLGIRRRHSCRRPFQPNGPAQIATPLGPNLCPRASHIPVDPAGTPPACHRLRCRGRYRRRGTRPPWLSLRQSHLQSGSRTRHVQLGPVCRFLGWLAAAPHPLGAGVGRPTPIAPDDFGRAARVCPCSSRPGLSAGVGRPPEASRRHAQTDLFPDSCFKVQHP